MTSRMSSSDSGCRVSSSDRDSSGDTTEKNGFSVAPINETQRFSTAGSSASCWVLENRCTSSMNSTVCLPFMPRVRRAASTAARTSLTPALTAESSTNRRLVTWLTTYASVVLPVPGGPHSNSDIGASLSISLRNGVPAPVRCRCPITSSRERGRIRTASGAAAWAAASSASSNRLSDWPISVPAIPRPYLGSLSIGLGYPQADACMLRLSTGLPAFGLSACAAASMSLMSTEQPALSRELLEAQGNSIARRQSADCGIDPRAMRGRVSNGRWQRLQRGVYAAFSGEPLRETVLWAALLRAGPGAVLSHQTAAERHGLIDEPSSLISVTVPASRHPAQVKIPGVIVRRSDAILRTRHPAMSPPCTRVEDTVLDLIQIAASFDDAYAWICRAIGRRRTTADRIALAMAARKKMRWRREIALALGDAADGALSVLEYRYVHRVERPHGLPVACRQARIRQRSGSKYLDNL